MKILVTLALGGAVVAGAPSGAPAFKLAPPSRAFSGSGYMAFAGPGGAYECNVSVRGSTNATGRGAIRTVVFSPGAAACAGTHAVGLPWKVKAINATTANYANFAVQTAFGSCGPAVVPTMISGAGVWSLNAPAPPACSNVAGSFATSPPIVIVP